MAVQPPTNDNNPESVPIGDADTTEVDSIAQQVEAASSEGKPSDEAQSDLAAQLAEEKDRGLRLQAEMQNLRNRTSREIADERRYAPMPLLRELLPVVDNINRAIEAAEQESDAESLLEGFKLVRQQLMVALEQHNCKPIEALGQPFDPQFHEAILQQPSEEQPKNHISLVTQVGYQLHDRVVRPSQVIISTGPAESEAQQTSNTER